jgi:hypothetical protein
LPHGQTISTSTALSLIRSLQHLATIPFLLERLRLEWSFWELVAVAVLAEEMHQQRLCDAEVEVEVEEATFQQLCQ